MSDPGTSYRTREEVKIVRDTKDPINLFKINLTKLGITENETKVRILIFFKNPVSIVTHFPGD